MRLWCSQIVSQEGAEKPCQMISCSARSAMFLGSLISLKELRRIRGAQALWQAGLFELIMDVILSLHAFFKASASRSSFQQAGQNS